MNSVSMTKMDEITMRLVHYFITKENYQPVLVNGVENEIWLENLGKKYSIIRINSNYIHNDEQLQFDLFKTKSIVKQIKKKTFSISFNTLNILLNVGDSVSFNRNDKYIDLCKIDSIGELSEGSLISSLFPEIRNDVIEARDDMDFLINVTNDINETTEKKNRLYEHIFMKKIPLVTYVLIAINCLVFLLQLLGVLNSSYYSMNLIDVKNGEWYRLFTSAFFHADIVHIFCNMYSLYIIGKELETVMGKTKFLVVYLISIITSALFSGVINGEYVSSVGASGAIFGLMGALLYFGYHYRLYFGSVLIYQIVPLILINLFIGFQLPFVNNYAHIGGLIGGIFASMMVGVEGKTDKTDTINGSIVTLILIIFLMYMALFRG